MRGIKLSSLSSYYAWRIDRALKVDRVPQHEGRHHVTQSAGTVATTHGNV
ncbi:Uncharacterised protein [Burkholderia pseudomallei]|nr:Uncharacterised protein [Burkholderia pseudomallei]